MIKRISRTKRIKEVKDLLSEVGMNFKEDKDWNTFQVWPDGDKRGGSSTYDTLGTSDSDLEDALGTGLDMAKRLKKANPRKCKTFQVKRKVGKKTIQVRRKVCNPRNNTKLSKLIGTKVIIYDKRWFNNIKGILEISDDKEFEVFDPIKIEKIEFDSDSVEKIDRFKIYIK